MAAERARARAHVPAIGRGRNAVPGKTEWNKSRSRGWERGADARRFQWSKQVQGQTRWQESVRWHSCFWSERVRFVNANEES